MNAKLYDAARKFRKAKRYAEWWDCLYRMYPDDKSLVYPLIRQFRDECRKKAKDDPAGMLELLRRSYDRTAPDHFEDYIIAMEWNRTGKFYLPRRNPLHLIVEAMQDLADDKIDLLTVSLPPGVGKTTTALFFLTWLAGRDPAHSILTMSHNAAFLRGTYDECYRFMDPNGEYRFHEIFPKAYISATNAQYLSIDLCEPSRFASLQFSPIGAQNAGRVRAMQLLYCDDLCSGIEEAMSRDRMDALWMKYTADAKQRKSGKCKELHIATRWSVADPIGRLMQLHEDDPRARFISIPALNEKDESNFDYPGGLGFTTEFFREMRQGQDAATFGALYQGEPVEREGLLYEPASLRRYFRLPEGEADAIVAVCDPAEGGGDFTVLPVFARYGEDHYLIEVVCSNALPEVSDGLCVEALMKTDAQLCQFESNAAGGRTADKVQAVLQARGARCRVTKRHTQSNKETKIIVNSPWVKEHVLFLDQSAILPGTMYASFMRQLYSYTVSGKNKHDDVPDALAQYALLCESSYGNKATIIRRPF